MRLLNVANTLEIREFVGSAIPPYAILSHTWEDEEVILQQINDPASVFKKGHRKIRQTCALAALDGLGFAWVDTCCIDKTSSAELSEAINSMFQWYENAQVCYVFLADLASGDDLESALEKSRWFSRGWTLQELIAPRKVAFFDSQWEYRGNKMSWAAHRQTTRAEDLAYCLLGIFDVHMSLIYGEGMKAFFRLQEAIVRDMADLSIFAWTDDREPCPQFASVLAESPQQFASCKNLQSRLEDSIYRDFLITTRGIQVEGSLLQHDHEYSQKTLLDIFSSVHGIPVGICLRKIGGNLYTRFNPSTRVALDGNAKRQLVEPLTLTTRIPHSFPFHGNHPVLGNRHSVLRFSWAESSLGFQVIEYRPVPRSHWDNHDGVFFGANSTSKGWSAMFLRGALPGAGVSIQLNFLVACFYWNIGAPGTVIADLSSFDPATVALLEFALDKIKFESCRQAADLVQKALGQNLHKTGLVIETGINMGKRGALGDSQPISEREMVSVKVSLGQERQPGVCTAPVTRIDIAVCLHVPRVSLNREVSVNENRHSRRRSI